MIDKINQKRYGYCNMNIWNHLKTITVHKWYVMRGCFSVGLYWQGLTHDLSKYMPSEFIVGAKYWQGTRSPNNAEREAIGYSSAWLHHKGRNRHHCEYWLDYPVREKTGNKVKIVPARMPDKYIVEMFMDRLAACKVYNGSAYTDADPLAYYSKGNIDDFLHPYTKWLLEKLLKMNALKGERYTCAYIRKYILKNVKTRSRKAGQKNDR